jgi:hypothetical protein
MLGRGRKGSPHEQDRPRQQHRKPEPRCTLQLPLRFLAHLLGRVPEPAPVLLSLPPPLFPAPRGGDPLPVEAHGRPARGDVIGVAIVARQLAELRAGGDPLGGLGAYQVVAAAGNQVL